jgi:hypothetical protein
MATVGPIMSDDELEDALSKTKYRSSMTDPKLTPPPELVAQWTEKAEHWEGSYEIDIATQAAQWGADQQLAEDAKWLDHNALNEPYLRITPMGESLKEAMRPKPPSLKEEALEVLGNVQKGWGLAEVDLDTIRRALEALPE